MLVGSYLIDQYQKAVYTSRVTTIVSLLDVEKKYD